MFKKSLTVAEVAEALFVLMRKDFNPEWMSRLSAVPNLDLGRAESELVFLDVFATYLSLKFTHSSSWRDNGHLVFEKLLSQFVRWLGDIWASNDAGTRDDAFRILDERLKGYSEAIEDPRSENRDEIIRSIGLRFAIFAFANEEIGDPGSPERDAHYGEFLTNLMLDYKNVVVTVAGEVFDHRGKSLLGIFDSYNLN
jgi:hypothetical protein